MSYTDEDALLQIDDQETRLAAAELLSWHPDVLAKAVRALGWVREDELAAAGRLLPLEAETRVIKMIVKARARFKSEMANEHYADGLEDALEIFVPKHRGVTDGG